MMTSTFIDYFLATVQVDCTLIPLAEAVTWHDHAQNRTYSGRAEVQAFLCSLFRDGFSNVELEWHHLLSTAQSSAADFLFRGRQIGPFAGLPPTGQTVSLPMALFCTTANDNLYYVALYYDAGTLLRQLGLAL